jgi:ADP-heptose:LPS heptosyltransferase
MRYILQKKRYIILVFLIDLLGATVFLPFRIFKRRKPGNIANILIIRLDDVDNVLFSTPVLQNLKKHYRGSKITFLISGKGKDLVMDNPYADEIMCYDAPWFKKKNRKIFEFRRFFKLAGELRRHNYDLGIDLKGDFRHIVLMALSGVRFKVGYGIGGGGFLLHRRVQYREGIHAIEHNLDLLRAMLVDIVTDKPKAYSSKENEKDVSKFLQEAGLGRNDFIVVMHTNSEYRSNNWLDYRFADLVGAIARDYNAKVILVGNEEDKERNDRIIKSSGVEAINASGRILAGSLSALMKGASLFIGIDSTPAHIAELEAVPSVILCSGVNSIDEWEGIGGRAVRIKKDIACKGCNRLDCAHNICMDLISVEDVVEAVEGLVKVTKVT